MQPWRVDFHCHTIASRDGLIRYDQLLELMNRRKIDRVIVTDHNTIRGALEVQKLAPDRIIVGEEVLTTRGELLAAFVKEEIPARLEPAEALRRLKDQGAFISVSHPFDLNRNGWQLADLMAILPHVDAIEIFNSRCFESRTNQAAFEFARRHDLAGTVGSDAHAPIEVGRATLTLPPFQNAEELRAVIRSGVVEARLSSPFVHFYSGWARHLHRKGRI